MNENYTGLAQIARLGPTEMTENPYYRLKAGPQFGPTLYNFRDGEICDRPAAPVDTRHGRADALGGDHTDLHQRRDNYDDVIITRHHNPALRPARLGPS